MRPLLFLTAILLCCFNSPAHADTAPTVANVPSGSHPPVPQDLKVACMQGANTLSASATCPVLQWNGLTYWAYSYLDNRVAMAIVAYSSSGNLVKRWDRSGGRYVWKTTSDPTKKTVTFAGQANGTVTFSWSELAVNLMTDGLWKLGKVTNNTDSHVMFGFHVPRNGSIGIDALNHLTMVGILIDDNGILSIDPHGNTSDCKHPQWRTEIQFGSRIWEFYYDTGTALDITINPNQQFTFTPGPGGQVVPLGQPARCQP
jgi:hypothetical protein